MCVNFCAIFITNFKEIEKRQKLRENLLTYEISSITRKFTIRSFQAARPIVWLTLTFECLKVKIIITRQNFKFNHLTAFHSRLTGPIDLLKSVGIS